MEEEENFSLVHPVKNEIWSNLPSFVVTIQ